MLASSRRSVEPAAVAQAVHRRVGAAHPSGDLARGESNEVPEHDHVALLPGCASSATRRPQRHSGLTRRSSGSPRDLLASDAATLAEAIDTTRPRCGPASPSKKWRTR